MLKAIHDFSNISRNYLPLFREITNFSFSELSIKPIPIVYYSILLHSVFQHASAFHPAIDPLTFVLRLIIINPENALSILQVVLPLP